MVWNRGLKLNYARGPHLDQKRARAPLDEAQMSPRATKGREKCSNTT